MPGERRLGGRRARATESHEVQRRERSIDALLQLYTIVVGIALTSAVQRLVAPQLQPNSPSWTSGSAVLALMLFGTLIVTLVPFYHGAVRHIDEVYLFHDASSPPKKFAILVEFLLLFVEGVQFVALGELIRSPRTFYFVFLTVLATDVVWATLSLLVARTTSPAVVRWLLTNGTAGILLYVAAWTPVVPEAQRPALFLALAVVRSAFDYATNIDFYLGRIATVTSVSAPEQA